jgi:hypothetical protein
MQSAAFTKAATKSAAFTKAATKSAAFTHFKRLSGRPMTEDARPALRNTT